MEKNYEKYKNYVDFYVNILTDAETKQTSKGNTMNVCIASISSKVNEKYENTVYKLIFINDFGAAKIAKRDKLRIKGELKVEAEYTAKTGEVRKTDAIFVSEWDLDGSDMPQTKEANNRRKAAPKEEEFDGDVPF